MLSQAADEWLVLLEALEQQRTNRVRAVALTSFIGETPQSLDSGGDVLADDVAERVRSWLDLFRTRGIAAVNEAARAAGLAGRVLAQPDGERLLTDLEHLGQMLHETARRNRLGLPALLEWFRSERRDALASTERTRRLDTDAAAVQILTIHGSKGLEYPVVYLPHFFDCYVPEPTELLFHDDDGTRRLDLAGSPDALTRARAESAGEELRLTYVALTRAQSQVVTWWGPSQNAAHSGLSRLLFGRTAGESKVPERVPVPTDFEATAALAEWQEAGALAHEQSRHEPGPVLRGGGAADRVAVRRFTRTIDTDWRRTSYSGLIRAEEQAASIAVDVEPEAPGTVDEEAAETMVVSRRLVPRLLNPRVSRRSLALAPQPPGEKRPPRSMTSRPRWRISRPGRPSGRWCTACSSTPTPMPRTSRPSSGDTSRSSAAGGRWTHRPTSWPRRCCRCSTPRSDRSPAACASWTSHCPTGCASSTSSSRSSGVTVPTGRSPRCTWV